MATSNIDIRTSPATCGARFAVHDSNSHLLPNKMYCRAFIPSHTGTLSVIFADDTTNTAVEVQVVVGLEYHMSIKQFRTTGTTTVTHVTAIG